MGTWIKVHFTAVVPYIVHIVPKHKYVQFCIIIYYIKWVTTSWRYSIYMFI